MDNTLEWIKFTKMCSEHGAGLDFVTDVLYEYCVSGEVEENWTFSREEVNDFIDGIVKIKESLEE